MKLIRRLILLIIIILILIYCYDHFNVKERVLKAIYPLKYSEYVEKYAQEYNVDKLLIYSIIKAESNFKNDANSNKGAIGLMQLMEVTAKEIDPEITKEKLFDEETNIRIGVAYFSKLLTYYNNSVELALVAYNAGIGNVDKWIEDGTLNKDGSNIENTPFKESNNYVRKILNDYEIYKKLYGEEENKGE